MTSALLEPPVQEIPANGLHGLPTHGLNVVDTTFVGPLVRDDRNVFRYAELRISSGWRRMATLVPVLLGRGDDATMRELRRRNPDGVPGSVYIEDARQWVNIVRGIGLYHGRDFLAEETAIRNEAANQSRRQQANARERILLLYNPLVRTPIGRPI